MPEGHSVKRSANKFEELFQGENVAVSSPQGRFTDSKILSGQTFLHAQPKGKQLFLHFEESILQIHLGIYGKWSYQKGEPKEPVGQVRARFQVENRLADLRGPTICSLIDIDTHQKILERLGPDPLWDDPDGKLRKEFIARAGAKKTPIGQLLMDQGVISGIGNVFRAEILFRANLSPFTPGNLVPNEVLGSIWDDSVDLLALGVRTSVMLTRENFQKVSVPKDERYWVYKREGMACRQCGNPVSIALMAARKLYWCGFCQK